MDRRDALELLGLAPDEPLTHDRLRRSYLRRLRAHPPERDPDGFRRLRAAFEMVEQSTRMEAFILRITQDAAAADRAAPATGPAEPAEAPVVLEQRAEPDPVPATRSDAPAEPVSDEPDPPDHEPDPPDHEPDPPDPDEPDEPDEPHAPYTLGEVTEEILAHLERDQLEAARQLRDRWNRSALDDHREVSPYVARRWALTRELLEVAPAMSSQLRRALARGIAADDMSSTHDAVQLFAAIDLDRARDLARHLAKRAPNLHQALGRWLDAPDPTPHDARDQTSSGSLLRWLWIAVLVITVLGRASKCSGDSDPLPAYRGTGSSVPLDEQMLRRLEERARRVDWGTPSEAPSPRDELELQPRTAPDGTTTRTP